MTRGTKTPAQAQEEREQAKREQAKQEVKVLRARLIAAAKERGMICAEKDRAVDTIDIAGIAVKIAPGWSGEGYYYAITGHAAVTLAGVSHWKAHHSLIREQTYHATDTRDIDVKKILDEVARRAAKQREQDADRARVEGKTETFRRQLQAALPTPHPTGLGVQVTPYGFQVTVITDDVNKVVAIAAALRGKE